MWANKSHVLFFLIFNLFLIAFGEELRFTNPIFDQNPDEPFTYPESYGALQLGSYYYLARSEYVALVGYNLWLWKSPILTDFRNATRKLIYSSSSLIPGTIHVINGELYMYAQNLMEVRGIYAMKAKNASDPFGEWDEPVLLFPSGDLNEATVMRHGHKNYLIFIKTYPGTSTYEVLISEMITPTQISDNVVPIGEGNYPVCLYNRNVTYLIRSASAGNMKTHLNQMSIPFEKDPLNPENWEHSEKVFVDDDDEGVIMPRQASFVQSPDLSATWMIYTQGSSWDMLTLLADKISWNDDGSPKFPRAHGPYHSLPVPSGQTFV